MAGKWAEIKKNYAVANRLLGDIIKVTPSSKTVGDLSLFLSNNNLSEDEVLNQAEYLSFPQSVIEYFQGALGIPHGGFPEPFRSKVLKGRKLPNGKDCFEGRPGAELPPIDFNKIERALKDKYGENIQEKDVVSYSMYPSVFDEWMKFINKYGDVSVIPTKPFVSPVKIGEEISFDIEKGKTLFIKLKSISDIDSTGHREVTWELNGENRVLRVPDHSSGVKVTSRPKAAKEDGKQVGSPMNGVVVDVRVTPGRKVTAGQPLIVLSAMKMETVVAAPREGIIKTVSVNVGDNIDTGDLVIAFE